MNLTALREMVRGWKVADLIIIFGSIDITMGEVDR
jgi:NADH-quinone oxidoreductase subunit D